jgi:hypothetical protein
LLRDTAGTSRLEALHNAATINSLQQQLAITRHSSFPAGDGDRSGISKLFRTEAIREMLKDEAKAGIARNVNALMNSGIADYLKLGTEQQATLKTLLTDKASIVWNQFLLPLTTGDIDADHMADTGSQIKAALEQNQAQLLSLLGDDGYSAYEWYDKTQPVRDHIKELASSFANSGLSVSSDQQAKLAQLMADETAQYQFANDLSDPLRMNFDDWYSNFTPEKLDTYRSDAAKLNQQILDKAQTVLSPGQLAALRDFLQRQLIQSEFVMQTTTAMMASRTSR